jgi:hypothetical protein
MNSNQAGFTRLTDLCEIFQGIRTSDDGVFVLKNPEFKGKNVTGFSKALNETVTIEAALTRPFLKGKEIGRNAHQPVNCSVPHTWTGFVSHTLTTRFFEV